MLYIASSINNVHSSAHEVRPLLLHLHTNLQEILDYYTFFKQGYSLQWSS